MVLISANASPNCRSITRPQIAKRDRRIEAAGGERRLLGNASAGVALRPLRAKSTVALPLSSPGHFSQRLKLEALCPLADHACSASCSQPCGARSSSTGFLKFSLECLDTSQTCRNLTAEIGPPYSANAFFHGLAPQHSFAGSVIEPGFPHCSHCL